MHLRFNFYACPIHSPSGFVHLTHQNLSVRALFCLNSLAKVNTQLFIYNLHITIWHKLHWSHFQNCITNDIINTQITHPCLCFYLCRFCPCHSCLCLYCLCPCCPYGLLLILCPLFPLPSPLAPLILLGSSPALAVVKKAESKNYLLLSDIVVSYRTTDYNSSLISLP